MEDKFCFLIFLAFLIFYSTAPAETQLTFGPDDDEDPSWSPDGTKIVYYSNQPSSFYHLWFIHSTGGTARRITNTPANDKDPVWSPNGDKIAFSSDRSGTYQIWTMQAGGGAAAKVTEDYPYLCTKPGWSPDQMNIAYQSQRNSIFQIFRVSADGGIGQQLTFSQPQFIGQDSCHPAWSPDGSRIAIDSRIFNTHGEICIMSAWGGTITRLTNFQSGGCLCPCWSPDGSHIAFAGCINYETNHWEIWIIPSLGGTAQEITFDNAYNTDPAWSPDGTKIAFTSQRNGNCDIFITNIYAYQVEASSIGRMKAIYK